MKEVVNVNVKELFMPREQSQSMKVHHDLQRVNGDLQVTNAIVFRRRHLPGTHVHLH